MELRPPRSPLFAYTTLFRSKLQRIAAGDVHALLGPLGQPVEGEVARGDLVPRRGDADLRLLPVVVTHADRAQHRPRRGLGDAVGHLVTARLEGAVRRTVGLVSRDEVLADGHVRGW